MFYKCRSFSHPSFIRVKNEGPMYIIFVGKLRFTAIRKLWNFLCEIANDVFEMSDFGSIV